MIKQKKLVSLVAVAILLFGTLFFGFKFVSQFLNNDSQVEDSTLVVSQPGIIEIGEKYKKVVVQVGGVELTNGLTDEIVVEASVGDGEVTLSDVSSKKMTLLGGGVNSIYISGGSSIQSVSIKRVDGNIRVVVTDTSNVSTMTVYDGSQDVVLEGQVGSVSIEAANININVNGSNMDSISVSGANTTVTVDENSNLNSATLTSTAEQSKYIFKGTVGSIQVDSNKSTIEVYGEVKDVTINDASENTTILVDKSGSIASMTSIASITTSGEGTIDEVTTDSKAKVSGTATVTVFNLPVNPVTPSKPSTTPTTKPASTGSTVSTSSSEGTSSSSSASSTSGSTSSTTTVNYTVAFNTNGGSSVSSLSLSNGSKIASSPTTSKTGYTFVGWYKEAALTNVWSFATDTVSANTTLYAKWTAKSVTISFTENGGSSVASISKDYGTAVSAPTIPTKTGYTFDGWYTNVGLTTSYTFSTMPASDLMLYAKWSVMSVTISFNENGGSTVASISKDYGTSVNAPTTPTKTGYSFDAWYSDSNLTTKYIFSTMPASNITLYAKWTPISFTINFDENGGSTVANISKDYGANVSAPTVPTKSGFTFDAWYSDVNLTTKYTFSTMPASNITLYANWIEITHTLEIFNKSTIGLPTVDVTVKLDGSSISSFTLLRNSEIVDSTTNGVITVPSQIISDLSVIRIKIDSITYQDSDSTLSVQN